MTVALAPAPSVQQDEASEKLELELELSIIGLQLRENCALGALAVAESKMFAPALARIQFEISRAQSQGIRPYPETIAAKLVGEEIGIDDVPTFLREWSLAAPAVLSADEAQQVLDSKFRLWHATVAKRERDACRQQADEILRTHGVEALDDVQALLAPIERRAANIVATPFVWSPPEQIPRRDWVFGRHAVGGYISVTGAAGGIGKSSLIAAELLSVATGKNILKDAPVRRGRVWYVGLEDPLIEHQRRFTAAALLHNLSPDQFAGRLFLDDASQDFVVARDTREGVTVAEPVVAGIIEQIRRNQILLLTIDPFVGCHSVSENDNGAINEVASVWRKIARETGCSVELIHHSRKSNGQEVTADDMRGASSLAWAARSVRTLVSMTKEEGDRYGVSEPWRHFRVAFGKSNLAPRDGEGVWRELVGIDLRNGGDGPSDKVAAVAAWSPPDASTLANFEQFEAIKATVSAKQWRADFRSKSWVGNAVAQVLDLDLRDITARQSVNRAIKAWIAQGDLCVRQHKDASTRKDFDYVEVAR